LRRVYAGIVVLVCFLTLPQSIGAEKIRLKWVTSIYADADGISLKFPEAVACGDDFVVVGDTGNSRLVRYKYQGPAVVAEAEFPVPKSEPIIVQVNSKGTVYFLDGRERRIAELGATGEEKGFLNPKSLPFSEDMVAKSFRIDDEDSIYVLDVFNGQVVVLDADGQFSRRIAFPKEHGFFCDLAVDRQGRIFLLDCVEAVVYLAPKDAEAFSPLTASMKEYMNFPSRLTVDDNGVLYLVDQNGSGLGLVGQDGSFLGRKLGLGWNESGLFYPSQICVSRNGSVFIADRNNSRVQMFTIGGN
jgi:streptogramin lyase